MVNVGILGAAVIGGKSQNPASPDPYATAAAQTQSNRDTAAFNTALARTNSYTPTGSHTYQITGTDPQTGAPIYSESTTLSPEQQALYNSNTSNQLNQSGFAGNALDSARSAYKPLSVADTQGTQDALYHQNTMYLDPQFAREQQGLDAKLAAQGITPGSEAYKNATAQFGETKNQAYDSARTSAITGATQQRGQNIQQDIALQNQPLNYYNSLMSGSQGTVPQFSGANPGQAAPTDVAGNVNSAYQGNVANASAQNAAANSTTSTIGSLLAAWLSDERLKRDIKRVGQLPSGLPVYKYKYLWSDEEHIGVMAQEAQEMFPDAVQAGESGYLMVNHHALA